MLKDLPNDWCPEWPDDEVLRELVFGLNKKFRITAFSVREKAIQNNPTEWQPYSHPKLAYDRLRLLLNEDNDGGSFLVTGFRGTGKTSLVTKVASEWRKCLEEAKEKDEKLRALLKVPLSISTSLNSIDLIELMLDRLHSELLAYKEYDTNRQKIDTNRQKIDDLIKSSQILDALKYVKREYEVVEPTNSNLDFLLDDGNEGKSYKRQKIAAAQGKFKDVIEKLSKMFVVLFIFDELDKLIPNAGAGDDNIKKTGGTSAYTKRLVELQDLVSDLKFMLAETRSFQVFIAGKDVDDNWLEDQNKGEGLFESVFSQNVYVPSLLSAELELDKEAEKNKIAKELGIPLHSWSYNTLMILLPLFLNIGFNVGELLKFESCSDGKAFCKKRRFRKKAFVIFVRYLTYKGRGIPRKIQRELYSWVQKKTTDENTKVVISLRSLRKMGFYADIVERLEVHYDKFSWMEDRAKVAVFHITDYILKFYDTGFTKRDIEHANFMRFRPELYPSPTLVATVMKVFEGRLFRRMHRRGAEYRLLPSVIHSLKYFSLAFSQEQMELRNTDTDHQAELEILDKTLAEVKNSKPDERLLPSQAQFRMGEIQEYLGHYFDARLSYSKALRWVRQDISGVLDYSPRERQESRLRHQDLQSLVGMAISCYHRLGRLRERLGEYRDAVIQLHEAEFLFHAFIDHSVKHKLTFIEEDSINDNKELRISSNLLKALGCCKKFSKVKRSNFKYGLNPISSGRDPEKHRTTLNSIALLYEKINERTAANLYLLKALQYTQLTNDEYGEVEQLLVIGQMQVKRRDFITAVVAYSEGLKLCDQLADLPFGVNGERPQSGSEYQTQPVEIPLRARLLVYLGDLYYATGGDLFGNNPMLDVHSESLKDIHRQVWKNLNSSLGDALKSRVYEDRLHEIFYTHASYYFIRSGDEISHIDVQLRRISTRIANLKLAIEKIKLSENSDLDYVHYEMCTQYVGVWRGITRLLNEMVGIDTRNARQIKGAVERAKTRNRLGTMLALCGELCLIIAISDSESVQYLWDADPSKLGESSFAEIHKLRAKLVAQEPQTNSKKWTDLSLTIKAKENLEKYLQGEIDNVGGWYADSAGNVPIGDFIITLQENKGSIKNKWKIDAMHLAEKCLLSSYQIMRSSAPNLETGRSAFLAGRLYTYCARLAIENGVTTKKEYADLYLDSYIYAKRYLIYAKDIFHLESKLERSMRYLISDVRFTLVDLLSMRLLTLHHCWNGSILIGDIDSGSVSGFSEEIMSSRGIKDYDVEKVSAQIIEHARKGLESVNLEIEDYFDRYAVPEETFFSNRHLIDPVSHFQVSRSVHSRHRFWMKNAVSNQGLKTRDDFNKKIEEIVDALQAPVFGVSKSKIKWLSYVADLQEVISKYRVRGAIVKFEEETKDEKQTFVLNIKPSRQNYFYYFGTEVNDGK